jgi:hypothetical protein
MKYLIISLCCFLLIGCGSDNEVSECLDCIWTDTSKTLITDQRGGIGGDDLFAEIEYTRETMPNDAFIYLQDIRTTRETYTGECAYDSLYDIVGVIDGAGNRKEYYSNNINTCASFGVDSKEFIDSYEMATLLRLLKGEQVFSAWTSSSQRIEIAVSENIDSGFETIVDLSKDTMSDEVSAERLDPFLRGMNHLTFTTVENFECNPKGFVLFLVTIKDKTGIERKYYHEYSGVGCSSGDGGEISYIRYHDIIELLNLLGIYEYGTI